MVHRTWLRAFVAVLGGLALVLLSRRAGSLDPRRLLSRRGLLQLGGLGLGALITGQWRNRASAGALSPGQVSPGAACVLTPEQTEGPYYIPREKMRRNITENKPGSPLTLRLTVVDAATCKPIPNAAVDIWHCDAGGIYSGFIAASQGGAPGSGGPTDKRTFLRGVQFTNAHGVAEIQTIYPGWYRGRTVHIHVKVHLHHDAVGHVVHTGQLFFSDTLTANVYKVQPYRARAAARDTFNSTDSIFQSGGRQSMLTMKRSGRGFVGSITMGVRRA